MTDTPADGTGEPTDPTDPTDPTQPERLEPPVAPNLPTDLPPAATAGTAAPTQEVPVTAVATDPGPTRRRGVMVPWWALAVVAALVVFGGGFLIGNAVGDDGHGERGVRIVNPGNPFGNGNANPFGGNGNRIPNPFPGSNGNDGGNGNGSGGNGNGGNGSANATPAFLGVGVANSTDPAGVRVMTVVASGPASGAGLRRGDVITAIDGTAVKTETALRRAIAAHQPGDDVKVTYTRSGTEKTVTVSLGDRTALAQ